MTGHHGERGYRRKKAGGMPLYLVKADRVQGGLFDVADDATAKIGSRTVDALERPVRARHDRLWRHG